MSKPSSSPDRKRKTLTRRKPVVAEGPWFQILAADQGPVDVRVFGFIGWEVTAQGFVDELDARAAGRDLVVTINSDGGAVSDGLAIYNHLRAYPGNVRVVVSGFAASIASVIALAGDEVQMFEASMFMIHNPHAVAGGNSENHRKVADTLDTIREALIAAYTRRVDDRDQVVAWMDEETWFTAEAALEAGFVDSIIEDDLDIAACATVPGMNLGRFDNLPEQIAAIAAAELGEAGDSEGATAPEPTAAQAASREEVPTMDPNDKKQDPAVEPQTPDTAETEARARAEGVRIEAARRQAIVALYEPHALADGVGELQAACLDDVEIDADEAGKRLLAHLGKQSEPRGRVVVIEDRFDKLTKGATAAIMAKADPRAKRDDTANEFRAYSLFDLAREFCAAHGKSLSGLSREEVVAQALSLGDQGFAGRHLNAAPLTQGTSSFATLLANVATKMLMRGFEEAVEIYPRAARIVALTDFKQAQLAGLSEFSDLDEINEHGEYELGKFADFGETATLATYGKLWNISRQAIINDDLNAMTSVPRGMGRAARRKVGDLFANVLINNQTMSEDSTALFHADHNNTLTAAAPSTSKFDEARKSMRTQTGPNGVANGGANPSLVLVPEAYRGQAIQVIESETEIGSSQSNSKRTNYVRGMAEVLSDPRFDANSATEYYFSADPELYDAIVIGLLDGRDEPTVEQTDLWTVDGVSFKVRMDAVARAVNYRNLVRVVSA
ncbi:MAG: ClpP-like prohead protease/major capsid protein fusion protein [Gammaproteobacteria bacterium]